MSTCPLCRQTLPQTGVAVSISLGAVVIDGKVCWLRPQEARLAHVILEKMPEIVSRQDLAFALWKRDGGPDDYEQIVGVLARRLRMAIEGTRLEFITHYGKGISAVLSERKTA